MIKKYAKPVIGLTALGLGTSLGAKAIGSIEGGDASGLAAFSSFQPVFGTLAGTKMTLDMMQDIGKPFMKAKRRR